MPPTSIVAPAEANASSYDLLANGDAPVTATSPSLLVVYSTPASDAVEDEYNRWYTDQHVPEMLQVPGFVAVTRYRLSSTQRVEGAWPFERASLPRDLRDERDEERA